MARQHPRPWVQPHSHQQWQQPPDPQPTPRGRGHLRLLALGLFSGVVAIIIVLLSMGAAGGDPTGGDAAEIGLGDARE